MKNIYFIGNDGEFQIKRPENYSALYLPIANELGLKGAVTPNGGGDSKTGQNTFLLEPVSVENLHNNRSGRNFWCCIEGKGAWSAVGASAEAELYKFSEKQDESDATIGFMEQTLFRRTKQYGIEAVVENFVPLEDNVEIMHVTIKNTEEVAQTVIPIAAIPVYGRSADNIRDHRHVTSLLHRIKTMDCGVCVKPTMSFDERGHQKNDLIYYVCGSSGEGELPESFFPTVEEFIGEGGTFLNPGAVREYKEGIPAGRTFAGKEAVGGLRFKKKTLAPGERASYIVLTGIAGSTAEIRQVQDKYSVSLMIKNSKKRMMEYWQKKVNVRYYTGNYNFDNYLRWVSFQPFLRRIYGCSFLPHHDYGRGGKGWRDLWQDCLSLLIMDPAKVHGMIVDNYYGVRIDGTNATIIGEGQREFIADRNGIARVWMDHGVWPFITTELYIHQTGDISVLLQEAGYFRDRHVKRAEAVDTEWEESLGTALCDKKGTAYKGSILEHILLQMICAFYETGEHGHIRLRGADWNDAIDMAQENGESVAFTCAYAGNMFRLAKLLEMLQRKTGCVYVELLQEIEILLNVDLKRLRQVEYRKMILDAYLCRTEHGISGVRIKVLSGELIEKIRTMAGTLCKNIQEKEWIEGQDSDKKEGWYNSYYDDHKRRVEGYFETGVRMMLTGQVFAIMSGIASDDQVSHICYTADKYLYRRNLGGYRLNTDFHEIKFDMGRMFGFAYGEKENGAVFCHMTVMYAYSLYKRGFVREGYKAMQTLAETALDFETSKIYPGIPEYFNAQGRGMYHYLTGAASWYMLTMVTQVYGVRGECGDLVIEPKLTAKQFDEEGCASIRLQFAGKSIKVIYINPGHLEYGEYFVSEARCKDIEKISIFDRQCRIMRNDVIGITGGECVIEVILR